METLHYIFFNDAGRLRSGWRLAIFVGIYLVLMFFAGRALFQSTWAGVLAAALLALTPIHFIRGRLLLSPLYSIPFVLGWLWCLARFEQQRAPRQLMAACALLALGMYSYLAAVVKGTQFRVSVSAAGTKIEVIRGQVEVSDFKTGQIAQVHPGQNAHSSTDGKPGLSLSGPGTLSPIENQLSGLMTSLVAGWPRPPRRRPASLMRLSVSRRLVMFAIAGAVSPVISASSARVIGPLTRMACSVTRWL